MAAFSPWFLRGAAWLLICLPADTPLLSYAVEWPPLAQELRQLAEEEEWLDPQDPERRPERLFYWCQRLHHDLAGCPCREELLRWPLPGEVAEGIAMGRAYQWTCQQQRQLESSFSPDARAWAQAASDTCKALAPWEALERAYIFRTSPRKLYRLREELRVLRCLVGETHWANCTLPSPIPLQHFRRMD